MRKLKILALVAALSLAITACNLKVNLNTNLNDSSIQIEPNNTNVNQPAVNANDQLTANDFTFDLTPEKMIKQVLNKKTGEVYLAELKKLCGQEVMIFSQPANSLKVIVTDFNPGSDKPVKDLYSLSLLDKTCQKLEISKELSDFGARVLSPDQTKLAVALETNEAKELKVIDLLADSAKTVATLAEGETLNGGYGALSNHFDIKWLDNSKIQYVVYEDTIKNYVKDAPKEIEKVKEVRIADLQ